jgi:long-chain acyl-CoA synthetase
MLEKPWLSSYPPGVPANIDLAAHHSIVDIFEESCQNYADRVAYHNMGAELSFAELDYLSRNFAAALQDMGMEAGDRIALMMPNLLQYPVAMFGALRAGLVVVNTNPMYTARELRHQLLDSGAKAIVVVENFASVLEKVRDDVPLEHVIITTVGGLLDFPKSMLVNFVLRHVKKKVPAWKLPGSVRFKDMLERGVKLPLRPVNIATEDVAFLQYTGGTTGVAKGAMLTHRNIIANLLQARAWLANLDTEHEVIITALPLYHIFALTANCLVFLYLGGTAASVHGDHRRQHPVQRDVAHRWLCRPRFQHPQADPGWRHGAAKSGGRAMEGSHRGHLAGGVWPDRDVTGGLHQPDRPGRLQRLHRFAHILDRSGDPGFGRPVSAHR